MNWLAKINVKIVFERLGLYRSAALLFSFISICLFCGYRLGNFYHLHQQNIINEQLSRLDHLYLIQEQQLSQVHRLEVELEVERMSNQQAQQQIKITQSEQFELKKALAFYENVMAPEKTAGGIIIHSFNVYPTQSPRHFRYQFILVRHNNKKRYVKGQVEFKVAGSLNKQPAIYDIAQLSENTKGKFKFSFKYFQVFEGELTLPENFIAEQVNLTTEINKTRRQKYTRLDNSYKWQDILKKEQ